MITRDYSESPDDFKKAWLDENNPKGVIIDFPNFKARVTPETGDVPVDEGWYEHNDRKCKFELTTDTVVDSSKTYYEIGALTYTDEDLEDDSFSLKKSIQNGSNVDFVGCISSTMEFKVSNDFKYLKDQDVTATLTVTDGDTKWTMKVFTGIVDEVTRDKSRDLIRSVVANDYMKKLLDDYDVTDWYVWQYGDDEDDTTTSHTMYELRNTFWDYIANTGTVVSPQGTSISKKGEGWNQVQDATLINDDAVIAKTLDVTPIDFDDYIGGELIGGPFRRYPKSETSEYTQYDEYTITAGWDVNDLVARKQVIELGAVGTLFTYYYGSALYSETNFREYINHSDLNGSGIQASIKIPREEQEKLRETQITAATVLQSFCQFNGVFGQFNGDGVFEYIKIDSDSSIEIVEEYQLDVGYADAKMPTITGVVIFDKTSEEYSDDQIHTDYGDVKNGKKGSALAYYPNDRSKIEGDDAYVFTMDNNFLMNSYTNAQAIAVAENIYNQISSITMRNTKIEIVAMPWLKCGQFIHYYSVTEDTLFPAEDLYPSSDLYPSGRQKVSSVIMSMSISGTGLFKSTIEADVEGLSSEIVNLNEVISAEIFSRKIGNSRAYSQIEQTAERIEMKVVGETSSIIKMLEDEIELRIDGENGLTTRIDLNEENIMLQSQRITSEAARIDLIASEQLDLQTRLLNVEADQVSIKASKVSFSDLSGSGRTVINGANITTGTISCNRIGLDQMVIDDETWDVGWKENYILDSYQTSLNIVQPTFVEAITDVEVSGYVIVDNTPYALNLTVTPTKRGFYTTDNEDPSVTFFRGLAFKRLLYLGGIKELDTE